MRHLKSGSTFGRFSQDRLALMKGLAISLINNRYIDTTLVKAKELKRFLEPIITKSKVDNVANRRYVFDRLHNKNAVTTLFSEIAPVIKPRNGGYFSVFKAGFRAGDAAPRAYIRFVDEFPNGTQVEKK